MSIDVVTFLTKMGYHQDSLPAGDVLRRLHHLEGKWFVVSPIHWQATHNDAMIVACGEDLNLSEAHSRQWFTVLADFLKDDEITLYYHDATTWLIQKKTAPSLNAKPAFLLLQQSLMPHLKALDATGFWSRLITEVQMLFSQYPVKGEYPVNGIWIWGDGSLKPPVDKIMKQFDMFLVNKDVRRTSWFSKLFGGKA